MLLTALKLQAFEISNLFTGCTTKGPSQYNQALSERRAASVRRFLASQQVEPERLHPVGKGEQEPIASDPYAAENRRVQFAIASEETQ